MIDKSIRQHYANGEKVKKFGSDAYEAGKKLTAPLKDKYIEQDTGKIKKAEVAKTIGKNILKRTVAKKLGVASLNPFMGLLSMIIPWLSKKWGERGALQAFQTGFGSPQEGRELRKLENRRQSMLQRKEEGKNYSEKNLDIVTRAIAEAKGLDINNPNEMRNIDKPITQIQIEKRITEPQIIPETPEVISPHLLGGDPVEDIITERPEDLPEHLTWIPEKDTVEDIITERPEDLPEHLTWIPGKDTVEDIITPPVWNPGIAAQEEAEKQAAFDRAVAENKAKAAAEAAAARVWTPPVHQPHGGGPANGGGQAAADVAGGSAYSSPFKKGGRIDKALGGRSRDI